MVYPQFSSDITYIQKRIHDLNLKDGNTAVLCGGSAVQMWVGRSRFLQAREVSDPDCVSDIDLAVSQRNLDALKLHPEITLTKHRHTNDPSVPVDQDTEFDSYNDENGYYDIWTQWYEPSKGIVSFDEVRANSVWSEQVGVWVLTPDYLVAQRQRSIEFLTGKGSLTPEDQERLKKDYADLSALQQV